jgi:hypothetical protein
MGHKSALAATCVVLVAIGSSAYADQSCTPVTGHFEASLVAPGQGNCPPDPNAFCTAGRVWGGLQGTYEFVMTGMIPSATIGGVPTVMFFAGHSTVFVKPEGDQLFGTDTGSIDLPPGDGGFASLITFSGGTGTMTSASGQIRLRGEFDPSVGTTSGDYTGRLCR